MKKINSISWLRCFAIIMIVYDHIIAMRNPNWVVNKIINGMLCEPLNIIQNFGAFGVSLFLLISGFLMIITNENCDKCGKKIFKKILKIYLSLIFAFLGFAVVQFIVNVFVPTYWKQFSAKDWIYSATLIGYFNGRGDVINGTTWFLIPLFVFYVLSIVILKGIRKKGFGRTIILTESIMCFLFVGLCYLQHKIGYILIVQYFPFVFIPLTGVIIAGVYKSQLKMSYAFGAFICNYILFVLTIYKMNMQYYAESPYIVSYIYALALFIICLLTEKYFKKNLIINFCDRIGLPIYLLHMTWGGFLMSCLENILPYIVAVVLSIMIIILLSIFHCKFIDEFLVYKLIEKQYINNKGQCH